jgi:hypothetical protein
MAYSVVDVAHELDAHCVPKPLLLHYDFLQQNDFRLQHQEPHV